MQEDVEEVVPEEEVVAVEDKASTIIIKNESRREISIRGRGRGSSQLWHNKPQIKYYNCQKFGHYASECRGPNGKVEVKANYAKDMSHKDSTLLMV